MMPRAVDAPGAAREKSGTVGPNPGPLVAEAVRKATRRRRNGRRTRVLVIGNIGNGNVGDEAVFAGLAPYISEVADLTVLTRNPDGVRKLHRVRSIDMVSARAIKELLRTDVIAIGGGGIFGLGMPPLVRLLPFVICFARLVLRKRIVFQAIGAYPNTPQPTLGALRLAARLADAVLVRDEASAGVFRTGMAGSAVDPILVGDPAIYLTPAPPSDAREVLRRSGVDGRESPLVISLKPTPNPELNTRMIDTLAEVAQWWRANRDSDVVVLPMSDIGDYGLGGGSADAVLGGLVAKKLRDPARIVILPCDLAPALAKAVIGEAAAVIAVRLHASIFGWSMGVPLLTLPFEVKTDSWLAQIGGDAVRLDGVSATSIVTWLEAKATP